MSGAKSFKAMPSNAFPPCDELPDAVVEVDEMFQNAGEKGQLHDDPNDPPRVRANKVRGHGTWDNDRPPVVGTIGRETGEVRVQVVSNTDAPSLERHVIETTCPGTIVNTDEWPAYSGLPRINRPRRTVCHGIREYARDDDGDGINEVHTNTIEGFWTGLRNFLRPFRGVNKVCLPRYVAFYAGLHNFKCALADWLGLVLGRVVIPIGS